MADRQEKPSFARGSRRLAPVFVVLVALLSLAFLTATAAAQPSHSAASKHRKHHKKKVKKQLPTYWGAWIGSQITGTEAPWDMNAVSAIQNLVGKGLSLIELSSPLADCDGSSCQRYKFPTTTMQSVRDYGAIPFFSWSTSSGNYDPGALEDPEYQLQDIIAGRQDAAITAFAREAAAWGHPFFLRFDWEMNGNWFPWSEGVNGNLAGEYVAAWRHVHDIFTSVGATNATWVWCPYVDIDSKFLNLKSVYPGDAYVDWTCLDGFNWAKNPVNSQKWHTFNEIFGSTYQKVTRRLAPGKPMLLAEFASGGAPRSKAKWINQMFKDLRTRYRRIRGIIWFDKIDRGVQWPIETSLATARAFSKGIGAKGFRTNDYSGVTGPIAPPQ
jgi:Glycosyl hydrolase family 26